MQFTLTLPEKIAATPFYLLGKIFVELGLALMK